MNYEHSLIFGNSAWLWALSFLFPLIILFYRAQKHREELLKQITAPRLRDLLTHSVSRWKRNMRMIFLFLALAALLIALAKPRLGFHETKMTSHSRDVMIAIDSSRSMLATDVAPTRLARAKLLAQDVLNLLPGDRIGLIAFAGKAFLQAPLTLDHNAVRDSIEEIDTNIIPKGGTDISDAIRSAVAAFGKEEGTSRALIIMTDGEDLEEQAVEEAKNAASQGIRIFTIGIGSAEGSLIPIKTEAGLNDFVRDEEGKPVLSKLDVHRLEEIAQATGGFYEAFGADAARDIIQRGILPLQAGETGSLSAKKPIERYQWPAGLALLLLLFWCLITDRRRERMTFFILLCFLSFSTTGKATPGLQAYQQGNYDTALKDFEQRLQAGQTADEIRFDAGTAAYKKGDYKKAIDYFTAAMTSVSPKIQQAATYNLANALVRSGEAAEDISQKTSDWKNAIQHYDTVLKANPKNSNAKENREIVEKLLEDLKKNPPKQNQNNQNQNQQKNDQQNKDQEKNEQQQQQSSSNNDNKKNSDKNQQQQQQNQQPSGGNNSQDQQNKDQQKNNQQNKDQQQQQNPQKNDQQNSSATPTPSPSATPTPSSSNGKGDQGSSPSPTITPPATPTPDSGNTRQQQNSEPSPSNNQEQSGQQQQPQQQQSSGSGASSTPQPTPGEKKEGALSGGEQQQQQAATEATAAEEGKDGMMSAKQAEALLRSMQEEEAHVRMQKRHELEETTRDW